jgi:threonine aldolase
VRVTPPQTNIVVATLEDRSAPDVAASLAERDVLAIAMDARTLRLVTHRDVSEDDCGRAVEAIGAVLG